MNSLAEEIYYLFDLKEPLDNLVALAISKGMIAKESLKDGQEYLGCSRNTSKARWNAKDNCFDYVRSGNFPGDEFDDTLPYPSDELFRGDIFVPVLEA